MKVYNERGLVKAWVDGVEFDRNSQDQVQNIAAMPFIHKHVAIMPDVHLGKGATIGSVIPTTDAIIPAAVGVDIGCGMCAVHTSLTAEDLPDNLDSIRGRIEHAVPHGRAGWDNAKMPSTVIKAWDSHLRIGFDALLEKHNKVLRKTNNMNHLGSLGGGNHFIEVCLDEHGSVWVMLHSGSRGVGNAIGRYFIEKAKKEMERHYIRLPDADLAYLVEGSEHFDDYVEAVGWAQSFARVNRDVMLERVMRVLHDALPPFTVVDHAVNCHHNYIAKENHFGKNVWVTRKGAVRAREGDLGIIPGSMGARSFIVRGKGNADSFHSCSHGAGRVLSRSKAKELVSVDDHAQALEGVSCRSDASTLDETPKAYKNIDDVMAAQDDLVEVLYTLKQVLCVKG